jgi:hypothetical protein
MTQDMRRGEWQYRGSVKNIMYLVFTVCKRSFKLIWIEKINVIHINTMIASHKEAPSV